MIPPPLPFVPPTATPQGRPELLVVAPQQPIAAQTTRAITGASRGKEGGKAANPDNRGVDAETGDVEAAPSGTSERTEQTPRRRGNKLSIEI
ncbi:MAG: hypothetical protein HYR63_13635 [Proteobacteria bacterium]|nr:hypothetical protein [Pseudomonadota bacterium]MBI3496859.1 hypothetical protein [Pseudomonadota bacterium]